MGEIEKIVYPDRIFIKDGEIVTFEQKKEKWMV